MRHNAQRQDDLLFFVEMGRGVKGRPQPRDAPRGVSRDAITWTQISRGCARLGLNTRAAPSSRPLISHKQLVLCDVISPSVKTREHVSSVTQLHTCAASHTYTAVLQYTVRAKRTTGRHSVVEKTAEAVKRVATSLGRTNEQHEQ